MKRFLAISMFFLVGLGPTNVLGFTSEKDIVCTYANATNKGLDLDADLDIDKELIEKVYENKEDIAAQLSKSFNVIGRGSADEVRKQQRKLLAFSPYQPTGIYLETNESLTIYVNGEDNLYAVIANHVYKGRGFNRIPLVQGENVISSPTGGLLYFINENEQGSVNIEVKNGGSESPLFILDQHSLYDWNSMLNQPSNSNLVELKGERVLITVSKDTAKKYLYQTDPSALLRKHDEAVRIQDKVTGLTYETGINSPSKHYLHFFEDTQYGGWMYATNHISGFHTNAAKWILDVDTFVSNGWGPWHEQGHKRQQTPWRWSEVTEVTNNIYSLSVQRAMGGKSRLEVEGDYERAFAYLAKPRDQKDFNSIDDVFTKLVMFWQLELAFGENFYHLLHQIYREIPDGYLDNTVSKEQLFIEIASVVASRNLTPFFEQWGLAVKQETEAKIKGLPELQNEIWKGRDSNKIIEHLVPNTTKYKNEVHQILKFNRAVKDITITNNSFKVEIDKSFVHGSNRVKMYVNDEYVAETYKGVKYYLDAVDTGTTYVLSPKASQGVHLVQGDVIKVALSRGLPGWQADVITYITITYEEMLFYDAVKDIRLADDASFEVETDKDFIHASNRVMIYVNDMYIGETYNGIKYDLNVVDTSTTYIFSPYESPEMQLMQGDIVRVILSEGVPGDEVDVITYISTKYEQLQLNRAVKDIRLTNDGSFEVEIDKEFVHGPNRVKIYVNNKYIGETYKGSKYYLGVLDTGTTYVLSPKASAGVQLVQGDIVKVILSKGSPGQATDAIAYIRFQV